MLQAMIYHPCCLWAACIGLLLPLPVTHAASCDMPSGTVAVGVRHIIDGDTVILQDGTHVRAIGIDTPELGGKGRPHQTGAREARSLLKSLLGAQPRMRILLDETRKDKYQRLLAHWFLPDGKSIQARLLKDGAATILSIPPNLTMLNCYLEAQAQAVTTAKGLWGEPAYALRKLSDLRLEHGTYYRLIATVDTVFESRSSIWLGLGSHMAVRISKVDRMRWFPKLSLKQQYQGRSVILQGKVYKDKKGRFHLRARHPSDILLQDQ